jgi:hypothetical protein
VDIERGDMVLLTLEASASVLRLAPGARASRQVVGLVLEELESIEHHRVWGVMVEGQGEQILESEIEEVIKRGVPSR